ncbi:Calcium permease family membrane transporter [Rasamsonia emersonii CBS 393.64]|uniref:Calcium permease family membrane transporter n=1 Tax=Rasamsonia emersonii (strain ATCC 16479 / CBS 393.64 / IMI 116815) TaxID=1408163 RepID=A0A0F4YVD0_RASE3|nr:Calcium permease family membrane transporter [Rasamsonia emersonii CBS 393.64]KKA22065.1 Calcium permease family membrane transporter [Rasamsonia emersonii CBS 393.64]
MAGNSEAGSSDSQSSSTEQLQTSSFVPIVRTDDEPSPPETMRRTKSSRQAKGNYGTMASHEQSSAQTQSEDDSTLRSQLGSTQTPQSPAIAPQADKARKPSVMRRMSSKRPTPHRGQEFSVDDDADEVEQDNALQQQAANPESSPRIHPLRRKSSTLRRRAKAQMTTLSRRSSRTDGDDESRLLEPDSETSRESSSQDQDGENEDGHVSDAESFTLKDRQEAINETHPFGIRIWKPALYKKNRSVEKTAEGDIHSSPGGRAVACFLCAFSPNAVDYGRVFFGLSRYLLYPFGSFVRLETDEHYAEEDEGEGRSISEYEQWQSGDLEHGQLFFGPLNNRSLIGRRRNSIDSAASEHDSLLGRTGRGQCHGGNPPKSKRRLFGRGEWSLGRVVFFTFFYFLIGPLMLLVSLICWMMVFWIPMGRVMNILVDHLRRHPLALSFHSDTTYTRLPSSPSSSILVCTYRAAGLRYWKYTIDGTNIFFINLLGVVAFAIFDYWILGVTLGIKSWLTHPGLVFTLALLSIIPLAYFIGQAVASISAQSSMGLGAAVNAFFSTIVEVYLYCVALSEGKAQLVEGSLIGSIFAGILFLPGLSMCFGAIKRKTQRFNVKSAGVTSTMLLFAVIAAFGPTLFYQIYGSHELNCRSCVHHSNPGDRDCRRCYFSQVPAVNDKFFLKAVQPYSWFAAVFLFLSYVIGLWFTLRTHAAVIWTTEGDEKKAAHATHESSLHDIRQSNLANGPYVTGADMQSQRNSIRDSQLYKRILGQSLKQVGLSDSSWEQVEGSSVPDGATPHVVPPRQNSSDDHPGLNLRGLTEEDNENLARQVAEVAATAAAVAARDAARSQRKSSVNPQATGRQHHKTPGARTGPVAEDHDDAGAPLDSSHSSGGHDAPNWGKAKSSIILLVATLLYAVIAEMLVNTVDVVLDNVDIDEKFLGITLFALVPNTTEFLNAISFAMNGNIALSMEIGSAYALQVCLLQIPALVLYSAVHARFIEPDELLSHSFNLIFPQWDMVTVILCVFLLSNMEIMGVDRFDTLALGPIAPERFYTIGRTSSGVAYPAS